MLTKVGMSAKFWLVLFFLIFSIKGQDISASYYLGHGFDAKFGMFGLAPIFEYTYQMNQTWISPFSGKSFLVPDQMYVSPNPEVYELVMQGYYSSYSEYLSMYREWFNFDIGISVDSFSAGFTYDKQLGYVHDTINQYNSSVMHGTHWWTYYTAVLYPYYVLNFNPIFSKMLDGFPETINNQNDIEYATQFVDTFGTHYQSRAFFGAKMDFNAAISQALQSKYSYEWIVTQYSLYFHYKAFNISNGGFANKTDINISLQFLENTNSNVTFYGGDPTFANLDNITLWVNSLDSNTFPMNCTMNGIWNLIENQTKRTTMQNFMVDYIAGKNYSSKMSKGKKNPQQITCLGQGLDTTTLTGCLAPVYKVNSSFIQPIPQSQLIQLNLTMTDSFSVDAWSNYHYTSSYGFLGMGTKTSDIYKYYNEYYNADKSLVMFWLQIAYYLAAAPIIPMPQLDPLFVQALKMLPDLYDPKNTTTQKEYFDFLQTFGLAVVDEVILGGYFQCKLWYGKELVFQQSEEDISVHASWSFLGIIGDGYGHQSKNYQVDQAFNSTLAVEYSYLGGNLTFDITQWQLWLDSVDSDLAVISYHLLPITLFIENDLIRNNVMAAMSDYTALAEEELAEYIENISKQ